MDGKDGFQTISRKREKRKNKDKPSTFWEIIQFIQNVFKEEDFGIIFDIEKINKEYQESNFTSLKDVMDFNLSIFNRFKINNEKLPEKLKFITDDYLEINNIKHPQGNFHTVESLFGVMKAKKYVQIEFEENKMYIKLGTNIVEDYKQTFNRKNVSSKSESKNNSKIMPSSSSDEDEDED